MYTLQDAINDALKDPEFRKEWEASEPEREIMHAIATNLRKCRMTHRELSKAAKISLRKLYKIEQGDADPSLRTLKRIADAMGMKIKIEFVPKEN